MAFMLRDMDFVSSKADPGVWLHPATKPDGETIYKYVLVYVENILAISHDPRSILTELKSKYTLKPSSIK